MTDHVVVARGYAESVVSGAIPACKWVRLACQRHLDDLAWQDRPEFPYRFDEKAARRACRFIELLPHVKGKWGRMSEKLILQPWQTFFVANVFGWKRKRDNLRRFRRAMLMVPRKNGKSVLAAAIGLYMLTSDNEFGAEVYSGATSEKQAWEVFRPAKLMALRANGLKARFGLDVNAQNLSILRDGSKFEPMIGRPGDGASPSCAIVDEYHEHEDDHMVATMETGMGAREHPLLLIISTAGDNIAGPCYETQVYLQKVLEGTLPGEDIFGLIYTVDPEDIETWNDPAVLQKANPNYGVSVFEDYLQTRQRDAEINPRNAGAFKTKNLNIWVQSRNAYFNLLRFQESRIPALTLDEFEGKECYVGVDLAAKRDLTAIELVFRHGDGFARFGRFYLPAGTIEAPGNDKFEAWRDAGHLIETDGDVTDFGRIADDLRGLCDRFEVRQIRYDPHFAIAMMTGLAADGLPVAEYRNTPSQMNEPMRWMDALITERKLFHDGNPLYEWMLSNVINKSKTSVWHMPGKFPDENKIDGPVATIMALSGWIQDGASTTSIYDRPEFWPEETANA